MSNYAALFAFMFLSASAVDASDWPAFRGPEATGVAPFANPPLMWSETENVRWKTPLPGRGSSTPIVTGNLILLTTAVETDEIDPSVPPPDQQPERPFGIRFPNKLQQFVVLAIDRTSGDVLWQREIAKVLPKEGHHPDNDFASASIVTDGTGLYAFFGSAGFVAGLDQQGSVLWKRDLGQVPTRRSFGEGASLTLHDGRLIVVRDNEAQSYLMALDAATGETIWREDRDEISAWATPVVVEHSGRTQIITNATNRVRSNDLESGELIWECGGQVTNVTPSPVIIDDLAICMSGYRGSTALAIRLDSRGDVTGNQQQIPWELHRGTPYIPAPLLYDDLLYFTQSNSGILTCVEAATGKSVIEQTRLPGIRSLYASPVGAAGRVYILGRDGTCLVIRHGREFEVLATNRINEETHASPVPVDDTLLIRGREHLWCFGTSAAAR